MIRITAKRSQGFWRCGVFHPPTATDYPDGRFTPDQVKTLKAEPNLKVELLKGEPERPPAPVAGESMLPDAMAAKLKVLNDHEEALDTREAALGEREKTLREQEAQWADRVKTLGAVQSLIDEPEFRRAILIAAIERIQERGKAEDLLKGGSPKTEAIEREVLGLFEIAAKERDELIELIRSAE